MSFSKISCQSELWCSGQNRTVGVVKQVLNGEVTVVSVKKKKKNCKPSLECGFRNSQQALGSPGAELGR